MLWHTKTLSKGWTVPNRTFSMHVICTMYLCHSAMKFSQ